VLRLAQSKARAAAGRVRERTGSLIVIGADTAVELDGETFGKPGSAEAARRMLTRLSGKTHHVLTGIAAIRLPDGAMMSDVEDTSVRFAALDPREIERGNSRAS